MRANNALATRTTRRGMLAGVGAATAPLLIALPALSQGAAPAASPAPSETSPETLNSVQYRHLEKPYFYIPAFQDEAIIAAMHGTDVDTYRTIRAGFEDTVHGVAMDLLSNDSFAARVDALPFEPGSIIVAIGASNTDDLQSWFEILRHLVQTQRPNDEIEFVNAGISGQSSTEALSRILQTTAQEPNWVLCQLGGNDAWRIGADPTKTLVSIEESEQNLAEMRHIVTSETDASWVWLTHPPIDEERLHAFPGFQMGGFTSHHADIIRFNEFIQQQPENVVDVHAAIGDPSGSELLTIDGLHLSLAGQTVVARTVVETLAE